MWRFCILKETPQNLVINSEQVLNKEKPWILFEAGALAKGLGSSRIYTLLVDLNPEDIRDPLAQFNHTRPTKDEMFKLVSSINKGLEGRGLKEGVLISAFKTYWPQFEEDFNKIIAETEADTAPEVPRPQEDVLFEILNSVRGIDKRVRQIEFGEQISTFETFPKSEAQLHSESRIQALVRAYSLLKKKTPPEAIEEILRERHTDLSLNDVTRTLIDAKAMVDNEDMAQLKRIARPRS